MHVFGYVCMGVRWACVGALGRWRVCACRSGQMWLTCQVRLVLAIDPQLLVLIAWKVSTFVAKYRAHAIRDLALYLGASLDSLLGRLPLVVCDPCHESQLIFSGGWWWVKSIHCCPARSVPGLLRGLMHVASYNNAC